MAHVNEGSHSFTCHPHVYPQVELGIERSLTFCVRAMLPERHQWKSTVQAAAVMLRTPPVDGQSPASPAMPTCYIWRTILRMPPIPASRRPAACLDPAERSHYVVMSRDRRKLVTRVRVMLP